MKFSLQHNFFFKYYYFVLLLCSHRNWICSCDRSFSWLIIVIYPWFFFIFSFRSLEILQTFDAGLYGRDVWPDAKNKREQLISFSFEIAFYIYLLEDEYCPRTMRALSHTHTHSCTFAHRRIIRLSSSWYIYMGNWISVATEKESLIIFLTSCLCFVK